MTLLALIVGVALSVSFLCSILEAALLSTRIPELLERRDRGDAGATLMLELKQKRLDDAISSILILNTVAHTIGAAMAGAQASHVFGDEWVGVFSAALTLAVLVATEIVPKTLGTRHASFLTPFVARTIHALTVLQAPILYVTRSLTRLLSHGAQESVTRAEIGALVGLASRQGALELDQTRVVENVLALQDVTVEDVMTPRTVVAMVDVTCPPREMLASEQFASFSRIPVYEDSEDNVVGYVLHRDVARRVAADDAPALKTLLRPMRYVVEQATVATALRELLGRHEHVAAVVDEHGTFAGIVTLEDLVETVLGVEIVDESDRVADMRTLALRLRERRLKRHQPQT